MLLLLSLAVNDAIEINRTLSSDAASAPAPTRTPAIAQCLQTFRSY